MGEFDKEQAIADIAENLGISKEYVNFDENKKIYIIKDNNNLKKIHIKNFNYKLYERYNLSFTKCIFECEIKDTRGLSSDIENGIFFLKCEFENKILFFNLYFKNISFILCNFKNNTTFQACTFKTFCNFESSVFENFASFDKSMFLDKVSFYNTHFHKVPNFSQAVFNGNLNAVNANLNFDFENLENKINEQYKEINKNKKKEDQKSLDKFANDFRDSFRTFKSALIKDNNALDASNFHKYELYCKEIELKQNWDKKGENVKNTTDLEKNVSRIRDFMDFLLLGFYRKLCDHHTDFLKVFNNLILLIALYALFVFGFTWLHDDKLEDTRAILTLFGFFDKFRLYFDIISTIFVVFGCGFFVCKLDSYEKKNNVSKKQNINFIYIIGDFLNLIKSLLFASFIPCVFYVLFSLFGFFLNLGKDFGYSLLINTLFVSLYICLVYTKSLFFGRYVVLIFSYIVFIIMLIKQPNVIHPLIGKIANESDKFFNYPSLIVLNILYTILLALVLFSLQKTARKNSIVPS